MKIKALSAMLALLLLLSFFAACAEPETPIVLESEIGSENETSSEESSEANFTFAPTPEPKKPFSALGTGAKKPEGYRLPLYSYRVDNFFKYDSMEQNFERKRSNWRIEGLKNKDLQGEINAFIKDMVAAVKPESPDIRQYIKAADHDEYITWVTVNAECINGYLSVMVSSKYYLPFGTGEDFWYNPHTAVWDLYTGKRLELTDLFWQGEDFITNMNKTIREDLNLADDPWAEPFQMIGDFWGLSEDYDRFTLSNAYFASREDVFPHGMEVDFSFGCRSLLATNQPRDMDGIWDSSATVYQHYNEYTIQNLGIGTFYEETHALWLLDADKAGFDPEICGAINKSIAKKVEKTFANSVLDKRFGKEKYYVGGFGKDVVFRVFGGYVFFNGNIDIYIKEDEPPTKVFLAAVYDLTNGKEVTTQNFFAPGWKDVISIENTKINKNRLHIQTLWQNDGEWPLYSAPSSAILGVCYDRETSIDTYFSIPYEYFVPNPKLGGFA